MHVYARSYYAVSLDYATIKLSIVKVVGKGPFLVIAVGVMRTV